MLRLALAENETWANNSTGLWVAISGARLPATAASPEERSAYLLEVVADPDTEVRRIAGKAAAKALSAPEFTIVWVSCKVAQLLPRGDSTGRRELIQYLLACSCP